MVYGRKVLPLLLCSEEASTENEKEPLDRLRLQKGVFLLEMRGPSAWRDLHHFEPYDWGPYSADLAEDLHHLLSSGEVVRVQVAGRRYEAYGTSQSGEERAAEAAMALTAKERAFVKQVRRFVTDRPFRRLLEDVYRAYPEYAVKSKFRSANR